MTILVNWNIYKPKFNGFQEARDAMTILVNWNSQINMQWPF